MSAVKKLIKYKNEKLFDSWQLNFRPLNQKNIRLNGRLFITDKNLYFDVKFNNSLSNLLGELKLNIAGASGHSFSFPQEIINQWQDNGYFTIPKTAIKEIKEESSFLKKTVKIKLSDDSEYLLDNGILSTKRITEAIKK